MRNLPDEINRGKRIRPDTRDELADAFLQSTGDDIREGHGEAYYVPSRDFISMPAFAGLKGAGHFYNVAFHELTHWTGRRALVDLTPEKADMLRSTLGRLFNEAVARPFDERAASGAASKQEALLRMLLESMPEAPPSTQAGSHGERARVLKAAIAAINEPPDDVLTIGDLCRIARASERTLERAFTERFGLPPAH